MNVRTKNQKSLRQGGFTLAELAIVLVVIGVLIAGILKGSELLSNSRVTATIAQIYQIESAEIFFEDKYGAMPGDLFNPSQRLANCAAAPCNIGGNGNGRLDGMFPDNTSEIGTEAAQFFIQLATQNLLTNSPVDDALGNVFGGIEPWAKMPGCGMRASTLVSPIAAQINVVDRTVIRMGLYLTIVGGAPGVGTGAGTACMSPKEALVLDKKLDDAIPGRGNVRVGGIDPATNNPDSTLCGSAGDTGVYQTDNTNNDCYIHIRLSRGQK